MTPSNAVNPASSVAAAAAAAALLLVCVTGTHAAGTCASQPAGSRRNSSAEQRSTCGHQCAAGVFRHTCRWPGCCYLLYTRPWYLQKQASMCVPAMLQCLQHSKNTAGYFTQTCSNRFVRVGYSLSVPEPASVLPTCCKMQTLPLQQVLCHGSIRLVLSCLHRARQAMEVATETNQASTRCSDAF